MVVYRLEFVDGQGPYQVYGVGHEPVLYAMEQDNVRRSSPREDVKLNPQLEIGALGNMDLAFGFGSLNHAHRWFPTRFLPVFAKYGLFLVRYQVPDDTILWGEQQCIFRRSMAILVLEYHTCSYRLLA